MGPWHVLSQGRWHKRLLCTHTCLYTMSEQVAVSWMSSWTLHHGGHARSHSGWTPFNRANCLAYNYVWKKLSQTLSPRDVSILISWDIQSLQSTQSLLQEGCKMDVQRWPNLWPTYPWTQLCPVVNTVWPLRPLGTYILQATKFHNKLLPTTKSCPQKSPETQAPVPDLLK